MKAVLLRREGIHGSGGVGDAAGTVAGAGEYQRAVEFQVGGEAGKGRRSFGEHRALWFGRGAFFAEAGQEQGAETFSRHHGTA
ncbi:hypothetical protein ACFY7H_22295 [Streptomyces sp. NPDC012794]|uniref:hypothetical protein n=1 Tax=Streptomyces sp. NPDC012794 TaxID=3364850 RepID=UPI0036969EC7